MPRPDLKRFGSLPFLQGIDKPRFIRPLLGPHRAYFKAQGIDLDKLDNSPESDTSLLAVFTKAKAPLPGELSEALYEIDDLADDVGHDRLADTANYMGVRVATGGDLTPGEYAIHVYLHHQRVFRRTSDKGVFQKVKSYDEFQALKDRKLSIPGREVLAALEQRCANWFKENDRGAVCEIEAYEERDEIQFSVFHGRLMRSQGTYDDTKRSRVTFRGQAQDSVTYDNRTFTLKVHAQAPAEKAFYRMEFAQALFGDANHFPDDNRYTLDVLRERGADALVLVPGVSEARWTDVWIATLDDERYVTKHGSTDLAATIRRHAQPVLTGGKLLRAGIVLKYGEKGRARKLWIRPPNVAIYDRHRDAEATERFLAANGIIVRRPAADGAPPQVADAPRAVLV